MNLLKWKWTEKGKDTTINRFKLIYVPLFIALFAIFTISITGYFTSKKSMLMQMEEDGIKLAKQTALQVEGNAVSLDMVNKMFEEKIRVVGKTVRMSGKSISNELLKTIAKDMGVAEINWFSANGVIIYSNIDAYLGWKAPKGHTAEKFSISRNSEYMEEIRKDSESENYNKYGFLRNSDGTFIELGIRANEVEHLTQKFSYQTLIDKLVQGENIVHVLFVDKNLKAIADSNKNDVNLRYDKNKEQEMLQALKGKTIVKDGYYKNDTKVLKIYVPVVQNGVISNVLIITFSTEKVYQSIYFDLIRSLVIVAIMIFAVLWIQNRNVIKPVNRLDQGIHEIDTENNIEYRLELEKGNTFFGVAASINHILDKTSSYFFQVKEDQEELQASNEEILGAYQQLAASEEELRAQYDEIQSYTEKLEELQKKYEIAIKETNTAVWEYDVDAKTIYFSEEFINIVGTPFVKKENVYQAFKRFLNEEDETKLLKEFRLYINQEKEEIYERVQIKDNTGNFKWILVKGKGGSANKSIKLINGILIDITLIKEQEEYIEYIAYHDALTNLTNRRMFVKKLEAELNGNKPGAVMLLDLDNFKEINDTLGHGYGDKVLRKVAEELGNLKDGNIFVSRFGGDEFFVLIEEETDIIKIENYAKQIISIFQEKLVIENDEIYLSCSMGITMYPYDSGEVSQLIMNADMAMYKVKKAGKNNYEFFNVEMTEKLQEQIKIEKILRAEIKNEEFKLLYQPQFCTFTGEVVGFEALIRLKKHAISPVKFISVAEDTGIIVEIGRWVTKEAIRQIAEWKNRGLAIKPIAVNFSAKQLNDTNYIQFLVNELAEANIETKYIEIEITESVFLEKKEETIEFLHQLMELGVKISLDDFGTGYSSLSYLTFLPVNKIKLDKSLNDKFLELEDISVMESLVSLAHSLNLEVVAEGIEEVAQYERLKAARCNYIQGYLFSKPIEAEEIEAKYL